MQFDAAQITTVSLTLFAIIDVFGALPLLISLRQKNPDIQSGQATLVSGAIMVVFLFLGEQLLQLVGIDMGSFATAGAIVIFIIAMEMLLGHEFIKSDYTGSSSIVPLAFPLIAGTGTLTTLLALRAEYRVENIVVGIVINLVVVYAVLRAVPWLGNRLGRGGLDVLRRVFGVVLLAIAVKLFKNHSGFFHN